MNDKRSDPVFYDNSSGYYLPPPDVIQVPWDNDDFTLCLDNFSSKRIIGSKYVKYPTTASPLRRQWRSSHTSSDVPHENDKEENKSKKSITLPGVDEEKKDEAWILSRKPVITKKKRLVKPTDDTFPYNNSSHLAHHRVDNKLKKKPIKVAIPRQPSQRAEHVSPLLDSSIILKDENDIFHTSPQLSPRISFARRNSNASSCLPSIASVSSFNLSQSQSESWKVTQQRPWRSNSPIIVSTTPTIYSRPNTPIKTMKLNHKTSALSAEPPRSNTSASTEHKVMPKKTEAFYANRTSSVYSSRDSLSSKPRTYSGYFNPTFSLLNKKAKRRNSQKKKSLGLFSKLVKNLKHHFVKTQ
ncbi:uncharacterized protein B0P05DRAFT_591735 [Gilbertella persicaria]|uniref:uncharacterized protein n=1 Tax=Gilbertella persicaria TaxID=101096 RepID=UPI00221F5638|nr:uncharacterized protein B0P05DRAFT_591735 [Gilbertella persicaria]KAI8052562.1 hypothetical protein B0P05DRAFT_591735 [Gilbertella persicaria]